MLRIGSHVSFKKPDYLFGAAAESVANNATAMMIYLGAPQNTLRAPLTSYKLDEYIHAYGHKIGPEFIVVHAPYIINTASPSKSEFATNFIISEIKRMNYIGAKYLVLHPGSATDTTKAEAERVLINNVKHILSVTTGVTILLETMAGKGQELGTNFEDLARYIDAIDSPRVGICLDTCHIWDAGYDIVHDLNGIVNKLKSLNLLSRIAVLHINDSKNPRGSHKDRHENIGKGLIGLDALRAVVHHHAFRETIKILETPVTADDIYAREIALLK